MRQIQVILFCDYCAADGNRQEPATTTFTVGLIESQHQRPALHVMDVCEVHDKTLQDFAAVVQQAIPLQLFTPEPTPRPQRVSKEPVGQGTSPSGQIQPCPWVGCQEERIGRTALAVHIWREHHGRQRPASPNVCPDCKLEGKPQSIGQHRRAHHSYDLIQEAMAGTILTG